MTASNRPPARRIAGAVDLSGLRRDPAPASGPAASGPAAPAPGAAPGATGPTAAATAPTPAALANVIDVTEANFAEAVLDASAETMIVVDLGTPRAPGSPELTALLGELAANSDGTWKLARVNVDTAPGLIDIFKLTGAPTVRTIFAGRAVSGFEGTQEPETVVKFLIDTFERVGLPVPPLELPAGAAEAARPPVDPRFLAAEELVDAGDYDGAIEAYQAILNVEPANAEAKAALVQIRFLGRATRADAEATLAALEANPRDISANLQAADIEVLSQLPEAAFDRLITLFTASAPDQRAPIREHLVSLFDLFDPADPRIVAARRKFASALF